jgi:multiple sugar transport system permease protein
MTVTASSGKKTARPRSGRERPGPPRTRRNMFRGRLASTVRITILTVWGLYFLSPVYWLIIASTKSTSALFSSPALELHQPQLLQNLRDTFSYDQGIFLHWALNSVLYAVGGAAVGTLIAGMAGYYLAIYPFRGREGIFLTVIAGMLVPATALAFPLFLLFAQVNLTDTFWSVFLPSIVSPFSLYLCRLAAEASIPRELVEAGRIDGAGDFKIFAVIGSRLMAAGLVTAFLTQFVSIWNNFLLPLVMLQSQRLYPVTLGLFVWEGQAPKLPFLQAFVVAGSVVSIVPLVVAFLFLQRFWRSGLTTGAMKG